MCALLGRVVTTIAPWALSPRAGHACESCVMGAHLTGTVRLPQQCVPSRHSPRRRWMGTLWHRAIGVARRAACIGRVAPALGASADPATTGICGYHSTPSPQPPVVSARSQPPAPPPPFVRMLPIRIRYAIGCGAGAGEASPSASPPSPPDSPLGGGGFAGRPEGAGWRLSSPYRYGERSRSRLRHPRRHVHVTACVYSMRPSQKVRPFVS